MSRAWTALGAGERDVLRAFRTFNAQAKPFLEESRRHEG
jgi:hypothetical protein